MTSCFVFACRKTIFIPIIKEDSYEKDVLFYVELGEPQMSGGKFFYFNFKKIFIKFFNDFLIICEFSRVFLYLLAVKSVYRVLLRGWDPFNGPI